MKYIEDAYPLRFTTILLIGIILFSVNLSNRTICPSIQSSNKLFGENNPFSANSEGSKLELFLNWNFTQPMNETTCRLDEFLQIQAIYTDLNTSHSTFNQPIENANVSYKIINNNIGGIYSQGLLVKNTSFYEYNEKLIMIGQYTIEIKAEKTDYSTSIAIMTFNVEKKQFIVTIENSESNIILLKKSNDLKLVVNVKDAANQSVGNAVVDLTLNGLKYSLIEQNLGIYSVIIPASQFTDSSSDIYAGKITITKENFTATEINIIIQLKGEFDFSSIEGYPLLTVYFMMISSIIIGVALIKPKKH